MINGIVDSFPTGYIPTHSQQKILTQIQDAYKEGYKVVVCCAPTGSGKSFISKTLGNASREPQKDFIDLVKSYEIYKQRNDGSFVYEDEVLEYEPAGTSILTITKTLQDQYKSFFDDIEVLKGKSNFQCAINDNCTVDVAPCVLTKGLKKDCFSKNICPYYKQRNNAISSKISSLNYSIFFSTPDFIKKREYIICDEASELEDQIVKQFTCIIKPSYLIKCKVDVPPFNYKRPYVWLSTLSNNIYERIDSLANEKKNKNYNKNTQTGIINFLKSLHIKIASIISNWNESEFITETNKDEIKFTPLKIDKLSKHIFDHGEKILLMSATIVDHKNFCKTLGIDKYKYIEVDSVFDPKHAPIYISKNVKLAHYNLKHALPTIKKQIEDICKHHKEDKGLIHSHTNMITSYLQSNLKSNRYIFRERGVSNEDILTQHCNNTASTVIVSPSMMYGVDLKDDLARFQIIIKAPFLPLLDKRIEKLMKIDHNWYINKMLATLVQGCGRGIRSETDYCVTYILDGIIADKVIENQHKLPKYFINRFV